MFNCLPTLKSIYKTQLGVHLNRIYFHKEENYIHEKKNDNTKTNMTLIGRAYVYAMIFSLSQMGE